MYSGNGLNARTVELLNQNTYQEASIAVTLANNTTLTLTNADIISGSLSVDRYSMSGNSLGAGTAIAAEMNVTIENHDGRFDDISFAGAQMVLSITVTDPDTDRYFWRSIPMGVFYVEGSPRSLSSIAIRALDKMTKLDSPVDRNTFTGFPMTLLFAVQKIIGATGVGWQQSVAIRFSSVPNYNIYISDLPGTSGVLTHRQLLMWIGGLCGVNWYIDWDGYLNFAWYGVGDVLTTPDPTKVLVADESTCYSSDLHKDGVSITGLFYKEEQTGQEWLVGNADYAVDMSGNKLMDLTRQTFSSTYAEPDVVMNTIYQSDYGRTGYLLFDAEIKPAPYLWPMDPVVYTRNEEVYGTTVTHVHYKLNGKTTIEAAGETTTEHQVVPGSSGGPSGLTAIHVSSITDDGNADIGGDVSIGGDTDISGDVNIGGNLTVPANGLLNIITVTDTVTVSSGSASKTGTITISPSSGWTPVGVVGFKASQSWCFVRGVRLTNGTVEIDLRYTGSSSSNVTVTLTADVLCIHTPTT